MMKQKKSIITFVLSFILLHGSYATTCEEFIEHISQTVHMIEELKEKLDTITTAEFDCDRENIEDEMIKPLQYMITNIRDRQCGKEKSKCCSDFYHNLNPIRVSLDLLKTEIQNTYWTSDQKQQMISHIEDSENVLDDIDTSLCIKNLNRSGLRLGFYYFPGHIIHWIDNDKVSADLADIEGVDYSGNKIISMQLEYVQKISQHVEICEGFSIFYANEKFNMSEEFHDVVSGSSEYYEIRYIFPALVVTPSYIFRLYPFKFNIGAEFRYVFMFVSNEHEVSDSNGILTKENADGEGICYISCGFFIGLEVLFNKHIGLSIAFTARTFKRKENGFHYWYNDYYKILHRRLSEEYVLHPYQTEHTIDLPSYGIKSTLTYYF